MTDPVINLQQLGFSNYEARAYIALLQRHPLNGYELAKLSGVPRANIYGVLQKLEERGAVIRSDTPDGVRYAPVPAEELLQRLRRRFQEALDTTQQALNEVSGPAEYEYVGNMQGYSVLLEHAHALLKNTQKRLLLAIWPQEAVKLAQQLAQAEERGVEITTLCLAACPEECGGCRGQIYRYQVTPDQPYRWLVLIPDQAEVLTGDIGPSEETIATRTRQQLLVELATWYIRHNIALAAILDDLGNRLGELLRAETRSILTSIYANGQREGWLGYMVRLAGRQDNEATSTSDDLLDTDKSAA
jgi:HTH-type transcriptional regulator, sugar sensing transcriptional regulator